MSDGTQTSESTEATGETAQFTWTETRVFSAVVIPLERIAAMLSEHVPGEFSEALGTLLSDNADEDSFRPVFAAMAAYAAEGDIEVQEICDVEAEY